MGFCLFLKILVKNIGRSISKKLSGKYSQKHFGHTKQSATDTPKTTPIRVIQKTADETGDLTCNKIANIITKVPRSSL